MVSWSRGGMTVKGVISVRQMRKITAITLKRLWVRSNTRFSLNLGPAEKKKKTKYANNRNISSSPSLLRFWLKRSASRNRLKRTVRFVYVQAGKFVAGPYALCRRVKLYDKRFRAKSTLASGSSRFLEKTFRPHHRYIRLSVGRALKIVIFWMGEKKKW